MRMFSKVRELVENPNALVIVLIDEVESLTHARSSHAGVEPSDAIRTVNAVLTQLDNLKRYKFVYDLLQFLACLCSFSIQCPITFFQ